MSQFDISLIEIIVTFLLGGLMGWIACEVLVADALRVKLQHLRPASEPGPEERK